MPQRSRCLPWGSLNTSTEMQMLEERRLPDGHDAALLVAYFNRRNPGDQIRGAFFRGNRGH